MDDQLLKRPISGVDPHTILTDKLREQFQAHAAEAFPHEAMGVVLDGKYLRLDNVSDQPEVSGHIPKEQMLQLLKDGAQMLLHSHPNGPNCPSGADLQAQIDADIPFGLVATDGQGCLAPVFWGSTLERPPLLGRPFVHGVTDCVGLIMDYELVVNGRELPTPIRDWEWWTHESGAGLYEDNFRAWGYEQVWDGLLPGDVIFLRAGSKVVNHAAIYVGDHLILHHLSGRLENDPSRISTIEPVIRWQQNQRLEKVVRFKG